MKRKRFEDAEFRFGDHGPGYLIRGPRTDVGIVRLTPGTDAANHYHDHIEESFYVLNGKCTLWINCADRYELTAGDVVQCEPGEMHYFVNHSNEEFNAIFVKVPYDPTDGIQVPWHEGDPIPEI
ncbi:cupin domain-containing protein [Trueperella pyogenes]|uniref:cupin domain-containing protein n=1 Tax=Trueperella pyogenes TaxID=1661 RepID=UPI003DA7ADFD